MKKNFKKFRIFMRGDALERCLPEVRARNYENLMAFSFLGMAMMAIAMAFSELMRKDFLVGESFRILLLYFFAMSVITRLMKKRRRFITAAFYIWMSPVMIMGTLLGTFFDPKIISVSIMVFLCVFPLLILDKPWRIVAYILMNAAVYAVCCYRAKSGVIMYNDMIDLALFTPFSIGVNCMILRDRISNVEHSTNMRRMAESDRLTGISNRGAGEARIRQIMKNGKCGMFIIMDLDDFKYVNDMYGHGMGDEVLKAVAGCLKHAFRENDVVIRFGGDEFAVFAQGIKDTQMGAICMERLAERIRALHIPEIPRYRFSASFGVSFFDPLTGKSFETLYRESDEALYYIKGVGKNSYAFYGRM